MNTAQQWSRRRDGETIRELDRRMAAPQRHRLLQGYPMVPLMKPVAELDDLPEPSPTKRPVIVGVLPHPFCNPTVEGCGFCTFPHQKYHRSASERVVGAVRREIESVATRLDWLSDCTVPAVYVGGGTANLVEPEQLEALYETLSGTFDLTGAELSLEGAPRYFSTRDEAHLDLLDELDVGQARISMGVQTFDGAWLEKMGRTAFGAPEHVEDAVRSAKRRDFTTSCDLLFNLPGQSLDEMLSDIEHAADLGFDQICIYNLVLFHGLGTAWSTDDELLEQMLPAPEAASNWLALRDHLFELGFRQSTLTNFERADLPVERRFRYEQLSFQPEQTDGIGFGPAGLTTFASEQRPWKTMNFTDATEYLRAVEADGSGVSVAFEYDFLDRVLLSLTRQLAGLVIRRDEMRSAYGADPVRLLPREFDALERRGLVSIARDTIHLTPVGMFYADSVAGLLAWRKADAIRRWGNDAAPHHMG